MSFLKRLFGSGGKSGYVDKTGIYLFAKCDNCGSVVRVRADRQHDLNREGDGFSWHKTIVDSKCFRRMHAVVQFDSNYQISRHELAGGTLVDETAYTAYLAERDRPDEAADTSAA